MSLQTIVLSSVLFLLSPGIAQEAYKDVLYVARTKDVTNGIDPVSFDYVGLDIQGAYDPRSCRFYALNDGIYWVSLSAGAKPRMNVLYRLYRDDTLMGGIYRSSKAHIGNDTLSRDIMVPMKMFNTLRMSSYWDAGLHSDWGHQTSMSIFRLTGLMKTQVFFCVTRVTDAKGSDSRILQFPEVLVNEGGAYDTVNHVFRAPKDGVYFFSYSLGIHGHMRVDSILRRKITLLSTLERLSTMHTNKDLISRGGLFNLYKDDLIYIEMTGTSMAYSDTDRSTAFSGFLYEPIHGLQKSWSVAKTTSWKGREGIATIPFEEVLVNQGDGWQVAANAYIVPITGIYYVTLSVGAQAGHEVYVNVMVNGIKKANLKRTSSTHNGLDILSRSVILYLTEGSMVSLSAEGFTAIYSSSERQTSFSGFLLFPFSKPQ